jgi:outer membrane protein OmpA-like peptidoglycan-associated protein
MKKLHSQLMFKVIPCLGVFVLGACANFSNETSKVSASNPKANVELATSAPSISSALASVSGAWKPLFVAASPVVEAKADKPVSVVSSASAMPVGSANTTQVVASSPSPLQATPTAPVAMGALKMDRSLDSLKYAIYFEYASATLNPTGKAALEYLQADAKAAEAIEVIGRADPSGNASKNTALAQARANTVRKELMAYGVRVNNIKTKSFVALAKADGRSAYKQNLPADLSAASRRADVDMLVKPNVLSQLSVHGNFVSVPS